MWNYQKQQKKLSLKRHSIKYVPSVVACMITLLYPQSVSQTSVPRELHVSTIVIPPTGLYYMYR